MKERHTMLEDNWPVGLIGLAAVVLLIFCAIF